MIALRILLDIIICFVCIFITYVLFLCVCTATVKNKNYDVNSRFYRGLLTFNSKIGLAFCNVKIHLSGEEKLNGIGRFLIVQNHRSNFDPIITWCVLKKYDIAFISKKQNFSVPIFGKIARKCCFRDIDRENARNAIITLRDCAELMRNDVVSIGVYPEGTRSKKKEMGAFHDGVLKIAKMAGVPIVVSAVRGTEKVHKRAPFKRTHLYVDILEVIEPEKVAEQSSHELSAEIYGKISGFIEENDKD